MVKQEHDVRRWLWLTLAVYALLTLAMSLIVPLGESPDELDHFLYLRYLAAERTLPPLSAVAAENPTMEANQPPLYYALGAALAGWVGKGEPLELDQNGCFNFDPADPGRQTFYVHSPAEARPTSGTLLAYQLARVFSILLGGLTIWLAYRLGRRVVPGEPRAALLGAALLAFNPQFVFITASVNNDVLAATLGAALVLASVSAWHDPRMARFALLGVLMGLAALTKAGLLALWPVALLAAAGPLVQMVVAPEKPRPWGAALRRSVGPLLLVGGLPLIIAGWWYVRATLLYGDPLAWRVHLAAKGPFVLREGALGLRDIGEFADLHFRSSVGLFGWLNVALPGWAYAALLALLATAVAGLVWALLVCLRGRERCHVDLPAVVLTALAVLGTYASLLRYIQTINWSGYQGRLAYAAVVPIAVLASVGLNYVAHRAGERVWLAGAVRWSGPLALLAVALFALTFVLPAAYPRPGIYQSSTLAQTCARFDDGLLLDGFAARAPIAPGETLDLALGGTALAGRPGAGTLRAELRGDGNELWAAAETAVSWLPGETFAAELRLPVDDAARPGRATLLVGLLDASGGWGAARSANGRALDVPLPLTTVKIPAQAVTAAPQAALVADLGEELRLLGYDLLGQGQTLAVTLYWTATRPPAADYATFVHLLDADGRLLAQADSQPQDGAYPTAIWGTGEVVPDPKQIAMPEAPPVGPLRLVAGAYGIDGVRLTVADSTNDVVLLTEFADAAALWRELGRP